MNTTIKQHKNKKLFSFFSDVNIITINSGPKGGKFTFFLYMLTQLYREKAVFFTPVESYIFKKKLHILSELFPQCKHIDQILSVYYIQENFSIMKQKYGYEFILKEIEKLIMSSEEKFFVIHRINDFFDHQDRYEIPNFFKKLTQLAEKYDKKLVILANTAHTNFEQIDQLSQELSDIVINIEKNDKNGKVINILDILKHQEHPQLKFTIQDNQCILEYNENEENTTTTYEKNILLVELDHIKDNIQELLEYILKGPGFNIKKATTLQEILKEIFIRPDLIIVSMERTNENLQIIQSIKTQLPSTKIIAIINQDFVRTEDEHEFLSNGCEAVLSKEFTFDELILELQKALDSLFYTNLLKKLPKHNNILKNIDEMRELANECIENSIYFTSLVMKNTNHIAVEKSSRKTDYLCFTKEKVCYLAINTLPKETKHIEKKYNLQTECMAEAINYQSIEDCLK